MHNVVIKSIFYDNNNYYRKVFLDKCLHKLDEYIL